jgi:hypothetical protein
VCKDSQFNDQPATRIINYRRRQTTISTTWPARTVDIITTEIKTTFMAGYFCACPEHPSDLNAQELAEFVHSMHVGART